MLRARDKKNPNSIVALKKLPVSLTENGIPNNAVREISILKQLCAFNHPNIVKLVDIYGPGTGLFLIDPISDY